MTQFLKKILIFALIASSFIGLLFYCSSKIDGKRKEEKERNESIEQGTCVFDRIDLENLAINYNDKSFKSILDLDTLKLKFYEQLAKISINKADTAYPLRCICASATHRLRCFCKAAEYSSFLRTCRQECSKHDNLFCYNYYIRTSQYSNINIK